MTDDRIETDKPLAHLSLVEEGLTEPERQSATERLAAAREKHLGKDVMLHDGKPEMGAGSRYAALHPAHKAHLAAIEHLVLVEAEHAAAEAHLNKVHAKVEHALERVAATEEASEAVGKEV